MCKYIPFAERDSRVAVPFGERDVLIGSTSTDTCTDISEIGYDTVPYKKVIPAMNATVP